MKALTKPTDLAITSTLSAVASTSNVHTRARSVSTTHTAVPAGHDRFPHDMVAAALGRTEVSEMREVFCCDGELNLTYLALNLSHYINGVAKKHTEVSQRMFAGYKIHDITNGIHAPT